MLFERRLRDGLHDGTITLAFRRWQRPQVVAGQRYRTGLDIVAADAVDVVPVEEIDSAQAAEAGYASSADLLADLRGSSDLPLYRIRFRRLAEPDPRERLAAADDLTGADVAAITTRLRRMDRISGRGSWTRAVLTWIAANPATSSAVLARELSWPRQDLKTRIRRLKSLGLTHSLDTGYRLTPRGTAYLRRAGGDLPGQAGGQSGPAAGPARPGRAGQGGAADRSG